MSIPKERASNRSLQWDTVQLEDGTWMVSDNGTGRVATGATWEEAVEKLRRPEQACAT